MAISTGEAWSRAYRFAARVADGLDSPTVEGVRRAMLRQDVLFKAGELNDGISFEDGQGVADLAFEPWFIRNVLTGAGRGAAAAPGEGMVAAAR